MNRLAFLKTCFVSLFGFSLPWRSQPEGRFMGYSSMAYCAFDLWGLPNTGIREIKRISDEVLDGIREHGRMAERYYVSVCPQKNQPSIFHLSVSCERLAVPINMSPVFLQLALGMARAIEYRINI